MLVKNLPKKSLFPVLISRMILDGIAGLKFISQGKWKHCWAILEAHFSFYVSFTNNYKKRAALQRTKYYSAKSIVYNYYVNNGKVFVN
jgi:hypothetical protein